MSHAEKQAEYSVKVLTKALESIRDGLAIQTTLRDQFAMAALTGLLASSNKHSIFLNLQKTAYEYADGMMKERVRIYENVDEDVEREVDDE